MPFQVDEVAIVAKGGFDQDKPPLKQIPYYEFPKVVYKHPRKPFIETKQRINGQEEIVIVRTNHISRVIGNPLEPHTKADATPAEKAELEQALAEGWRLDPYVMPDEFPNAYNDLYDEAPKKKHVRE